MRPPPDTGHTPLHVDACVKCGTPDTSLEWTGQHNTVTYETPGPSDMGWMEATCRRCGYRWQTDPLPRGDTMSDLRTRFADANGFARGGPVPAPQEIPAEVLEAHGEVSAMFQFPLRIVVTITDTYMKATQNRRRR